MHVREKQVELNRMGVRVPQSNYMHLLLLRMYGPGPDIS
jgi:hypothetical protein